MKRISILAFLLLASGSVKSMKLYVFSGLGVDIRAFTKIEFPKEHEVVYMPWLPTDEYESLESYAMAYLPLIDTTEAFGFVGLSLGGMVATELAHELHPQKTVLISSARNKCELPMRYRCLNVIPLHYIVGHKLMIAGSKLFPLFMPLNDEGIAIYQNMVIDLHVDNFRKHVGYIAQWQRKECIVPIVSIHGIRDGVIPIRNKANVHHTIDGGHKLLFTHSSEINNLLIEVLG